METITATNPTLTLQIRGLALCHFMDSGIWKIFFPRVRGHEFMLSVNKKIGQTDQIPPVYVFPPATKIGFSVDNTTDVGTRNPNDWTDAIDLSNLHNEDIHLVSDPLKYAGILTLNGASLVSKFVDEPEEFEIWDARATQKNLVEKKIPANTFSTDFQFGSGASAKIQIENDFGFELLLPYVGNVSYEVVISNNCNGEHCESILDFRYLYNIIDESQFTIKRRFELIALIEFVRGIPGSRCGGSGGSRIANPNVV